MCICIAKSLCCPPKTMTALLIGYIPIQNKVYTEKKEKKERKRALLRPCLVLCSFRKEQTPDLRSEVIWPQESTLYPGDGLADSTAMAGAGSL